MRVSREPMDLSIIVPALNEAGNVPALIDEIQTETQRLGISCEIVIVDGGSTDGTVEQAAASAGTTRVITQSRKGYGQALRDGFATAQGEYILTMDADHSHSPALIPSLWHARSQGEMVIASRYVPGGRAEMPRDRLYSSILLNRFVRKGLSLPLHDLSSGYRLYHAATLKNITLTAENFNILVEIAARLYAQGWRIVEIPLDYKPRLQGRSKANFVRFGMSFLGTFLQMWRLRNSIDSADYDDRAVQQHHTLAALLATLALSHRHQICGECGIDARYRMRVEPNYWRAEPHGRDRYSASQDALCAQI